MYRKAKLLFALFIALICSSNVVFAQTKNAPKNIADYYMLLPAKYIGVLERHKNRKSFIKIQDIPNSYLRLAPTKGMIDWEGSAEIALFKKTNGEYIVGVVDGNCATVCYSGIEFLTYRNGKWTEVTKQVMPEITDKMILDAYKSKEPDDNDYSLENPPWTNYALPRKGTAVKVNVNTGGDDTLLFELKWNGEKFELKKTE